MILPDVESSSGRAVIGSIDDDSGVCPRRLPADDVNSGLTDWGDTVNAQQPPASTQYQGEKASKEALVQQMSRLMTTTMNMKLTTSRSQELAFLPDLTEPSVTVLDYEGSNVKNPVLTDEQQQ
ncbi:hypothetical protein PHMEG_0008724 [Phytophthora megakarya]|uniref:Eukaryotic/viral aspartic protease n=1 Tax=Phytophthora megakarya TaxID=4795 RepID=A0A225WIE7_9STRA|nr:hypothetical protein PHMEG_0008724 [Phytophthora megakarya]